jgi:hypothetical protein
VTAGHGPRSRLSREEALRLYTAGSAWFSGEEDVKGRITPGQYADFAVLSADYLLVPEEQIGAIESVLTVTGGDVVYAAPPFAALAPESLPPVSPAWSPVAVSGATSGQVNMQPMPAADDAMAQPQRLLALRRPAAGAGHRASACTVTRSSSMAALRRFGSPPVAATPAGPVRSLVLVPMNRARSVEWPSSGPARVIVAGAASGQITGTPDRDWEV